MKILFLVLLYNCYLVYCSVIQSGASSSNPSIQILEGDDQINSDVLKSAANGGYNILIRPSNIIITNITFEKEPAKNRKRACEAAYYEQYAIIDSGYKWSNWKPASCCIYCDMNKGGICGGDLTVKSDWKPRVNTLELLAMQANSTEKLSRSIKLPKTYSCELNGYENVTQFWYQTYIFSASIKKRSCVSACGTICNEWSKPYRVETPVSGKYNTQCLKGYDNVNCKTCG